MRFLCQNWFIVRKIKNFIYQKAKKKMRFLGHYGLNIEIRFVRKMNLSLLIFTVGEAVRSTCGNSHKEEEKEKEDRFHLSLHQTI